MIDTSPHNPKAKGPTNGFAIVAHALVEDDRLTDSDVRVMLAIERLSCGNATCEASLRSIGEKAGNKRRTAVKDSLRRLKQLGLIDMHEDESVDTHRSIVILWRPHAGRNSDPLPPVGKTTSPGRDSDLPPVGFPPPPPVGIPTPSIKNDLVKERSLGLFTGEGADGTGIPTTRSDLAPETIDALSKLGPESGSLETERAAILLNGMFSATDATDSMGLYRLAAKDVAAGHLTASSLVEAVQLALGPRVRNPGRAFVAACKRAKGNGGRTPASRQLAGPKPGRPTSPSSPSKGGRNAAWLDREAVIGHAVKAIDGRRAEGMDRQANRGETIARAERTCDERGFAPDQRAVFLGWIEEALADALGHTLAVEVEAVA